MGRYIKIKNITRVSMIIAVIIIICAAVFTINKVQSNKSIHNTYSINIVYDEEEKILHGLQTINIINNEKADLKELYFHLYPNAFKYEEEVPISKDEWSTAYPKGFSLGYIDIKELKVNDTFVSFTIEGQSDTILKVYLPKTLKSGKSVQISIKYNVQLPLCLNRFGYGQNSINVTNWYPILCVYDESGWNLDPYYGIGDPFYSDVADYYVKITMPDQYKIAHSGNLKQSTNSKDQNTYTISAENIRDFAWFASDRYDVMENIYNEITIKNYTYTVNGLETLEIATKALKTFNELFGKYPYDILSIAESDFYVGGMEYPQVVQIDTSAYNGDKLWLEYLIVHEIAHQWWYGVVGNDEIDEPWLDEGLTEYSTLLYFEKNYGVEQKERIKDIFISSSIQKYQEENDSEHIINMPIYKFDSWREYSVKVYSQGALLHEELRNLMSDERYFKLLRQYYKKYKFRNAKIKDFIKLANKVSRKDLTKFFEQKLGEIVK